MLRHHRKLHYYRYCRYAATIKLHASYVFFLWQDKSGYDRFLFLISVVKREEFLQLNNPFSKWDWIEYKLMWFIIDSFLHLFCNVCEINIFLLSSFFHYQSVSGLFITFNLFCAISFDFQVPTSKLYMRDMVIMRDKYSENFLSQYLAS